MSYRRHNRLRKGKRGIISSYGYNPRATYRPVYDKHRRRTPEWGALHRAWVGYVIAKSQDDDDSKLGAYDPQTGEKIRDAEQHEDEDEDDDRYCRSL